MGKHKYEDSQGVGAKVQAAKACWYADAPRKEARGC